MVAASLRVLNSTRRYSIVIGEARPATAAADGSRRGGDAGALRRSETAVACSSPDLPAARHGADSTEHGAHQSELTEKASARALTSLARSFDTSTEAVSVNVSGPAGSRT